MKYQLKFIYLHSRKCILICLLQNVGHFVLASICQYDAVINLTIYRIKYILVGLLCVLTLTLTLTLWLFGNNFTHIIPSNFTGIGGIHTTDYETTLENSGLYVRWIHYKISYKQNKINRSACRCSSNYIFILDLTPCVSIMGNDNCKTNRGTFKLGIWYDFYQRFDGIWTNV